MMWYWGGGVHWWGWLLASIGMVIFWGLIVWAIWFFVTRVGRQPYGSRYPNEPRQPYEMHRGPTDAKGILDERLARGEIDAEEYRRLLAVIRGERTSGGEGRPPVGAGDQR